MLNLSGCWNLTQVSSNSLVFLDMSWCKSVTDLSVRAPNLQSLVLSGCKICDNSFQDILKQCPKIVLLKLDSCRISTGVMPLVSKFCGQIEYLDISSLAGRISAVDLQSIVYELQFLKKIKAAWSIQGEHLSMISKSLVICDLKGGEFESIELKCLKLRKIDLRACIKLRKPNFVCPVLDVLELSGGNSIDDTFLNHIAETLCDSLSFLDLSSCNQVTSEAIESILKKCSKLHSLFIKSHSNLKHFAIPSKAALQTLNLTLCESLLGINPHNCTQLTSLVLKGCSAINRSALDAILLGAPSLNSLDIEDCDLLNPMDIIELQDQYSTLLLSV
eukprot:TRINITY_DN4914_c0_g1_i2.p1 TRINITY_DN4914_c0_g1~~TRINITY_DN4914_c0_g1_i2.p1  ORF type:complete len:332 (-),score=21.37 TRINITY_DN4914_c0_g1_i2:7-1002(-)